MPEPTRSRRATQAPHFDGIWKEAVQRWLPECMQLFWPSLHAQIDWSTPPRFDIQELQALHRIYRRGRRSTDLIAVLQLRDGTPALLLMHLEIQAGRAGNVFCQRMFHYRILLHGKYPKRPILSCALLLDRVRGPDMMSYTLGGHGDRLTFEFPVAYLARWRDRVAELELLAAGNPFAVIMLAQLHYRATPPDATRLAHKLALVRALKQWGYGAQARATLFWLIDSLLLLPEPLDAQLWQTLDESEDPDMLQRLSSLDRYLLKKEKDAGLEEGLERGLEQGLERGRMEGRLEGRLEGQQAVAANVLQGLLEHRFGAIPEWAAARIAQADADTLQGWALKVLDAPRIENVLGGE